MTAKKTAAKKPAAKKATKTYPDDVVAAVRVAEAAGQLAVVQLERGEPLPKALEKALDKRVEINLAATGGVPAVSMAGSDPTVQRLEAPHRRTRTATEAPPAESRPTALDTTTEEE